ncbi:MAG: glycine cleavage system protein R [Capsulimonadaceae bacterium]
MSQAVVITAVGQDRPGIIAGLARVMYDLGANLDDVTMTRLQHAFANMISATLPDAVSLDACRAALAVLEDELGLTITVQTVPAGGEHTAEADHLITVYGTDKPGIVYRVTERLSQRGVNITDMDTRRAGTASAPLYVMLIEVASDGVDLSKDLSDLRRDLRVDITIQDLDREAL